MKSLARFLAAGLVAVLLLCNVAAKKKKGEEKGAEKQPPKFDVMIPIKHNAKGVKLPYYDVHGKLQMNFEIEIATRIDNDHLQMKMAKMETYDEDGKQSMTIEMPVSILDLNTRVITSKKPVTVRRSDFEITGETMTFDTQIRAGKMIGKVRMLIFNRAEMTEPAAQ